MARTCCNNRTLMAVTSVWVLLLLTTLACAAKKYQTVQITNVHLHDSGAGMVDAYVTVQEGEFLFITDCGDARRVKIAKAWVSGAKIQARRNNNRVYLRNAAGKEYACDLLGRKHAAYANSCEATTIASSRSLMSRNSGPIPPREKGRSLSSQRED